MYELDINARQPLTQLSKKVRASPATIEYRLKRMEKYGFIKNYLTFLDAGKLGLMIWNVYLELQNTTEKEENEIVTYLCNLQKTWWVAKCSGRWNLIYSLCVKDVKEFYKIVNDVQSKYSKYILNQTLAAHVEVEIISRGYFLKKPGTGITWYKNVEQPKLDDEEIKILKSIALNARLSSIEIAKKTNLTQRIVSYRLKSLIQKGIINRFRLLLDISKIGLSYYKVIIYVKDYTDQKNLRLKQYCINEGNIFHYEQKMGPWMLELELDSENYESADKQLKQMKEQFPDFVRSYELLLIRKEPKGEIDLTKMLY
ncbi:Lrp/AsnC family transcriptional regulator [Candidatus Woesearchaeota archaeon]|nr:Lrp/AsnC family transcriptional regulator [Candidatus Woesearchaeota archaeon]